MASNVDRFLIIGASGFVGSNIVRFLSSQPGTEVLGTRTKPTSNRHLQFDLATDSIQSSLPAEWQDAGGRKVAVVCSAVVPMDRCTTEADYARAVMLDGTRRCFDDLVELGFSPVFISTSYVFDGTAGGYRENDAPAPISNYGRLKRSVEEYLDAEHSTALIARLDKVVSDRPAESNLLTEWCERAKRQQPIFCIEGQVFGPTLVTDIAQSLYAACQRQLTGYYHLANPEPIDRAELASRCLAACNLTAEIRTVSLDELNLPEARPLRSWLRSEKIERDVGFRFTSVNEILERFGAK